MQMPVAALPRSQLSDEKAHLLSHLTEGLNAESLWWLSGYAAGLAHGHASLAEAVAASEVQTATNAHDAGRLTILYGSQTGNARRVAEQLAHKAEGDGLNVRLLRIDAYPLRELKLERLLYVVISTQGDGDPPDDARAFVDFIFKRHAPELKALSFAVLGLGDSSYPQFCAVARRLDERLAALGAVRLFERGEADLDVETVSNPWMQRALQSAHDTLGVRAHLASVTSLCPHVAPAAPVPSRKQPFAAEVLVNQRITAPGATKDVRHLELDLQGSGIDYQPGDALALVPRNPGELVEAVLATLSLDGDAAVSCMDEEHSLREWLSEKRELTRLSRKFVTALAERSGAGALRALMQPEQDDAMRDLLTTQQPIDLLLRHPVVWSGAELVDVLRPLMPRLYSIASSRAAVGEEAHLTVAHIEYAGDAGTRWGAASHWLATRAEGESVEVRLEHNERFKLPDDPDRDIIMIGPGTGIAPFRAFVQERIATGTRGRNWLVFGNPHFRSDFLYQLEWQAALKQGSLHRLDLAFSRDHLEKIYVQHRLRENGRDVFDWLESGAHLYVCGASAMARDVEAALHDAIMEHGTRSAEAAAEYLGALRAQHRYAQDVY